MKMHNPAHPGEVLRELWLEPMGLTLAAAAARLGVTRKTVSRIANGKASISPEMALRLEIIFGTSAQAWLNMQAAFDIETMSAVRDELMKTLLHPAAC
jgi:addiction module HigA family antidote